MLNKTITDHNRIPIQQAYLESLIRFVYNPTPQTRSAAETQIALYTKSHPSRENESQRLIAVMNQLDSNDHDLWQELAVVCEELFEADDELRRLFEQSANNRGISVKILL